MDSNTGQRPPLKAIDNAVDNGADAEREYRIPPHNIEAEQALLGAILVNNDAAGRVTSFLLPEHFAEPTHGRIFEAILKLLERGHLATPITLKTYFTNDEALEEVGGAQYLARLAASAATIINAEHYGRTIYDLSLRRALIQVGSDMVNRAYDPQPDESATEQIEAIEGHLFQLAEQGQHEGGFKAFHRSLTEALTTIEAAYKRDTQLTGVATGLNALDDMLGGLHRSDLVILAGRPGMGKTAFATNIAFHAAKARRKAIMAGVSPDEAEGAVVGFFSLEMSAEQLATRMLSEQSGITSSRMRMGKLDANEFTTVAHAAQELEDVPFFIDDTPALSISALRTRARRLKRTQGLSLIVVDYLQLMRPSGLRRVDNRVQEITEITQGLKALAKELDLPVVALSQLSRMVEQRDDKRPLLADLRESGSIEQDADVVMFVYREEYYHERQEPEPDTEDHARWLEKANKIHGVAEIIIGKQRHGPTGVVRAHFNRDTTRFSNLTNENYEPYN